MSKKKVIDIDAHALFRILERGMQFGLDYYETKRRVHHTINTGNIARRKHWSQHWKTYYLYFHDNISFYVICKRKEFEEHIKITVKTVIIEEGRE